MSEKTFEENMAELQKIVEKLENGETNLDDAIEEFQKAMDLIKSCDSKLKEAEDTINKIVDENKDIVDEVMHSWQAFVQRLYTNESGIGEEISNRLEQLKIEREIQQGDMDLAKKGITDSLFDIDEYVDLEQRDNSLHEDFNVEDVLDSETVKV